VRSYNTLWAGLSVSFLLLLPNGVFVWTIVMAVILARTISEVYGLRGPDQSKP